MMCPHCGKDYKDVRPGQAPGRVYGVDDHFYRDYKRWGMICTNCGFVAEWIAKPTGQSYFKRLVATVSKNAMRKKFRARRSCVN